MHEEASNVSRTPCLHGRMPINKALVRLDKGGVLTTGRPQPTLSLLRPRRTEAFVSTHTYTPLLQNSRSTTHSIRHGALSFCLPHYICMSVTYDQTLPLKMLLHPLFSFGDLMERL